MKDLPVYKPQPLNDPLKRYVNKEIEDHPSPMDPPASFAPPTVESIPYEKLSRPLQLLMDDHNEFEKVLNVFDRALVSLKEKQWKFTPEISAALKTFFSFMDDQIATHTREEEKALFPILYEKLLETGEHSPGPTPMTPVDMMESDHKQVEIAANLVFNLLGLAPRIRDDEARNLLFEHAFQQGQEIVEIMKLHIYKENTTIFPLAQTLLTEEELRNVHIKMRRYQS